jgi:hypothetical protein
MANTDDGKSRRYQYQFLVAHWHLLRGQNERQLTEAEDDWSGGLANRWGCSALQSGKPIKKSIQCDTGFSAGERGAETVMNSHAEGDMIAQVAI